MFYQIASFEFRYVTQQPVFRATFVGLLSLAFAGVAIPALDIGGGGNIHKNAPIAIVQITLNLAVIFLFAAAAFVAGTVVRDDETGFAGILRTTRVSRFDYLLGRFSGSFLAIALAFLAVPLGIFLGSLSPTLDPRNLGAFNITHYLYAYFFLGLPTLYFTSAFLFAIATAKRSMTWAYVGLIGLLVINVIVPLVIGENNLRELITLIDPFALEAYGTIARYWSTDELNTNMAPITGALLWNRILFVVLGTMLLALARFGFKMEAKGVQTKKVEKLQPIRKTATRARGYLPYPRKGAATAWAQLVISTKFELGQIFKSPAFTVILLMGLAVAFTGLFFIEEGYGGRYYPVTRKVIEVTRQVFGIFPAIVAVYYAGELVWRDRERQMNLIVDATVAPNWTFVMPKILAITLALFTILMASVCIGIGVQIAQGVDNFEFAKYLDWYVIPVGVDMALLAVLAVACQVIAVNKYIGWGIMVLYLLALIFLPQAGFGDYLYLYGKVPDVLYSDMSGTAAAGEAANWFRLYWSAFAGLLILLTMSIWRRGIEVRLLPRLKLIPQNLGRLALLVGAALAVAFISTGAFIYTNTHIWNQYRGPNEAQNYLAAYEKALLHYETLPMPVVTDVKLTVEVYPDQSKLVTRGVYSLKNTTRAPLDEIHLKWDREAKVVNASIDGAILDSRHKAFNFQIFKLVKPLLPGASVTLNYVSELSQRGFKNSDNTTRLLSNGTFVSNFEFAPIIGVKRFDLLVGRAERRAQGLPEELKTPALNDPNARYDNYTDFDFVSSNITITTSADQTPIAPGTIVSDTSNNGRRTIRYASKSPIANFFSLQSGRYDVKTKMHKGIPLQVYYHPGHAFNVDRMLSAMDASLAYFQDNFGPYQYDYARVIEFPAYSMFAQAFAGTVPFSEGLGFLANLEDPSQNDVITYVAAHEMAHQYWGGQLDAAKAEGAEVLTETLAQYSAIMVYEKMYGPERASRLQAFSLDNYLRGRSDETVEEVPLMRSFGRPYLHYDKGLVIMGLMRNRLGEASVNKALRNLLRAFPAGRGAPYPTTRDLLGYLRAEASTDQQDLITDAFEKITLYDLRVIGAKSSQRSDGRFDVTMTVEAHKYYADGAGKETEAPLRERFTLGAFSGSPQDQGYARSDVIKYETRMLISGRQEITFITNKRPSHVAADPLVEFIDKRPDDNVRVVSEGQSL